MSWVLSEQKQKNNGAWTCQEYEFETEDEAEYQGRCDKAAGHCKWFEVFHS